MEQYEALYFFWLGIDTDTASRKQKLTEQKRTEEKVIQRLQKEYSRSEIEQALTVINRDIDSLNLQKNGFNLNMERDRDISLLNETKARLNQTSTEIGRLEIRRQLIVESKADLEKDFANVDIKQLEEIYKSAKLFIPRLQATFNDLLRFHNAMIGEKIKYVTNELPEMERRIELLKNSLSENSKLEEEIWSRIRKAGTIEELEEIVVRLNEKHEQKGRYEEQLRQWNETNENLERISYELRSINDGIAVTLEEQLDSKIEDFNKFFSKLSERLYGEQFILSYNKNDRAYGFKISSVGGNLGTGKKKGQIAAFDFAYIQFCEKNDFPCVHFILHDQIENIHDNQLKTLSEVSNETNSQFVAPVLRDKMPPDVNVDLYKILSLSQADKLFRA